jgi:hypothetical protein
MVTVTMNVVLSDSTPTFRPYQETNRLRKIRVNAVSSRAIPSTKVMKS